MRASTHIHGRNAATVDAVFVLRKPPLPAPATDFTRPGGFVAARVARSRAPAFNPTDADRACLRHAHAAARALPTSRPGGTASARRRPGRARAREALSGLRSTRSASSAAACRSEQPPR